MPNKTTPSSKTKSKALSLFSRGLNVFPAHTIRKGSCTCGNDCSTPGRHSKKVGSKYKEPTQANIRNNFSVPANIAISTTQENIVVIKVDDTPQAKANFNLVKNKFLVPQTISINYLGNEYHIFFSDLAVSQDLPLSNGIKLMKIGVSILMPTSVHVRKNGDTEKVTFANKLPVHKLTSQCEAKILKTITVKDYPETMKAERESLGLSMKEFALSVGMGESLLESIENGKVEAFGDYRTKLDPVLFGVGTK
jgi:hypothetical protein